MSDMIRNAVILGFDCAELTPVIYAARSNLKPLVLVRHEPGGQITARRLTTMSL